MSSDILNDEVLGNFKAHNIDALVATGENGGVHGGDVMLGNVR